MLPLSGVMLDQLLMLKLGTAVLQSWQMDMWHTGLECDQAPHIKDTLFGLLGVTAHFQLPSLLPLLY